MSICARCGAQFSCAMVEADRADRAGPAEPCWCTFEPAAFPVPDAGAVAAGASCWCPACLRQRRTEALAATPTGPTGPTTSAMSARK